MSDFAYTRWIKYDSDLLESRRVAFQRFLMTTEGAELARDAAEWLPQHIQRPLNLPSGRHNTDVAYRGDQRDYCAAVQADGQDPLAPTFDCWQRYFCDFAKGHKMSTVYRRAYGIGALFFEFGLPSPTRTRLHRQLLLRLSRQYRHETRHATPLYGKDAIALLNSFDTQSLRNLRDLTICVVAATRGFRSATIVQISLEDVVFEPLGVKIALTQEKTARNSEIIYTATPHTAEHVYCMPCVMKRLVDALRDLGIDDGPLFRRIDRWGRVWQNALIPQSVTDILRRALKGAGVPDAGTFSSHSFRHGVVIGGHSKGWTPEQIMQVTLHRSLAGLQPYLASLDCWTKAPKQSVLDDTSEVGVRSDQGWQHDH